MINPYLLNNISRMAANTNCDVHTIILIIIIGLIMAYTSELFVMFPVIKNLFADPITFIAMIVLVILVLLLDVPCGILLAFLILYLAVWLKNYTKNVVNRFTDITVAAQLAAQNLPKYYSESELFYNNKVAPNGNLAPFKPVDNSQISAMTPKADFNPARNQHDQLTKQGAPNRDGYDITGCRYDYKDSPQNLTTYGPPLANCAVYNSNQAAKCGTAFYPLNA